MSLFHGELLELLNTAGIHCVNHSAGLEITIAGRGRHTCEYYLALEKEELVPITFSRSKRFDENEPALLDHSLYRFCSTLCATHACTTKHQASSLADRDSLRGMYNCVVMANNLQREIALSERHKDFLSLLIIDIDHFKQVNDTHGHVAGDPILRQVAETIMEIARQTDICFRLGGEEFVVVLSKSDLEGLL